MDLHTYELTIVPKNDLVAQSYRSWLTDKFEIHRFLVGFACADIVTNYFFVEKPDEVRVYCFKTDEITAQVIARYAAWLCHISHTSSLAEQQAN